MAEKKCAPQVYSFFRLFVVFLYMVLFSNSHFQKMEKINLWNTAHFLCQTNNPLCAGVDSITHLLSCVPRLKKLHLKDSLKCCGGALFVRESSQCKKQHHHSTSSLQFVKTSTEYPKILFNYCAHARIILNFSKNICSIFVTFPKSDRRRKYTMLNYKE